MITQENNRFLGCLNHLTKITWQIYLRTDFENCDFGFIVWFVLIVPQVKIGNLYLTDPFLYMFLCNLVFRRLGAWRLCSWCDLYQIWMFYMIVSRYPDEVTGAGGVSFTSLLRELGVKDEMSARYANCNNHWHICSNSLLIFVAVNVNMVQSSAYIPSFLPACLPSFTWRGNYCKLLSVAAFVVDSCVIFYLAPLHWRQFKQKTWKEVSSTRGSDVYCNYLLHTRG